MATYTNNLRLKEITTGDEDGTWGTSTNNNLDLIAESLGYSTQNCFSSDSNATTTIADGTSDPARAMYFKVTSSATLTGTRTLTIAPNTVSRVMFIENATTGSQSIRIKQGSGGNVTIPSGQTKIVYLDGAGSGAAVVDALNATTFEDLFLASGGVINWDAGDVTITHSANALAFAGGTYSFDDTVTVTNTTTDNGVFIDQNGNGTALFIDTETTTSYGLYVNANTLTTGNGIYAYSNSAVFSSSGGLLRVIVENASATGNAANIRNDGTGKGMIIDQNGDGVALNIDSEATSANGITVTLAGTGYGLECTDSNIADQYGYLRTIPPVGAKTSSYTLATDDVGQYVQVGTGGSITIPDATFSEGDVVNIFNNTTGDITITCSITTAYKSGTDADVESVALITRGLCSIFFISGTVCAIAGAVR